MKNHLTTLRKTAAIALLAAALMLIASCGHKDRFQDPDPMVSQPAETEAPPEPLTYTFNKGLSSFPSDWSPHRYDSNADAELFSYLSAGLYSFELNSSGNGFALTPCMAADMPVDITGELVGSYGLQEGEAERAWLIPLRSDLCWQDGSPINASDFVESARRLLNPIAENARSSLFCEGGLALTGAADYRDQAVPVHVENATNARYTLSDLAADSDGIYRTPDGNMVSLALDYPLTHLFYGDTLYFYVETYGEKCFDLSSWDTLRKRMDDDGLIPLTDENFLLFEGLTTGNPVWGDSAETLPDYFVYDVSAPPVSWDAVGIFARGTDELVLVLEQPLSGFDLLYALTDCWLVNAPLYDACEHSEDGYYSNSYATSVETTMSCGPYVLKEFTANDMCYLTRNPSFFGLSDGEGATYQTTDIVLEYVPDEAERLSLFRSGMLDHCVTDAAGRQDYTGSDLIRSVPGDTCFLMVFNPDLSALSASEEEAGENINRTILSLPSFRRAMSLSVDRYAFCEAITPSSQPALGLFTPLIISDIDTGIPYRSTEQGNGVISSVWGSSAASGGLDLSEAARLFDQAWSEALEAGYLDIRSVVDIRIGIPSTDAYYELGYENLTKQFTEAVKGTKLEDKLHFTRVDVQGSECYQALKENRVDMVFGVGWAGSALDPHALMEAYISDAYRYDPSWDTSSVRMTFTIHGENYTASMTDWFNIMCGETRLIFGPDGSTLEFSCGTSGNPGVRLDILAGLERAVLQNYDVIPLYQGMATELWGRQVECRLDDYVFGLGFGGIKYMTFTCSDREWSSRISSGGLSNEP